MRIKTKCKNCGNPVEQDGKKSLKRCGGCGEKFFFSINIDGSVHQYHGRKRKAVELRMKKRSVTFSDMEIEKIIRKGYTVNSLARTAYEILILGIDKSSPK